MGRRAAFRLSGLRHERTADIHERLTPVAPSATALQGSEERLSSIDFGRAMCGGNVFECRAQEGSNVGSSTKLIEQLREA